MSQIRKRSLKATVWIYVGFLIGAVNTYFFARKDFFTTEQYGLTRGMLDISMLIFAFSTLGVTSYLYKFFPYYKDNTEPKNNDMLGLALRVSLLGFAITAVSLYFLEPVIIRKFSTNSILLVQYFYLVLPLGFCILIYNILEAYSYGFDKGVLTSLLKETIIRLYTFVIVLLKVLGYIDFRMFMIFFCLQYAIIVIILSVHLKLKGQLWLTFRTSKITSRFKKKILTIMAFTFITVLVSVLRQSIDVIVLAARQNLEQVGIFGLASYLVSVLQAPYRSIVSITIPVLSRAWKEKNYKEITKIYKRSSINLLCFSLFVFLCIWLNYSNAINFFGINPDYLQGKWIFFLLGIVTIVEVGTGVNGQIIGTSNYWRFELKTSLFLTAMIIPLSYLLTVRYGIFGPAIANLVSFTLYNFIRTWFLWKKFNMQPFSKKTVELVLIAVIGYGLTYLVFHAQDGLTTMIFSTLMFSATFLAGIYLRNISPDVKPIIASLSKRFRDN